MPLPDSRVSVSPEGDDAVDRAVASAVEETVPPALDTVLGKAVAILQAFTAEDRVLSLAELTRRTGMAKGTLHRVAADLVAYRLLDKTDRGYRLSGGLFELGLRASAERTLLEVAMPFLQDLYERTHETVHLGVRDGNEVVYIAKIGGHRQVKTPSRTGGRMPMHCTALGKILLAHSTTADQLAVLSGPLERRTARTLTAPGMIQQQMARALEVGVAFEREESSDGLLCIAAPILEADGKTAIAAISITGPVGRFRPEAHQTALRATASALSSTLVRRRFAG